MLPRFYCPDPIPAQARFVLPDALAHHACRVLRLSPGDALVLFDGQGGEYPAVIESAAKAVVVQVGGHDGRECESPLDVTLHQALPTGDKMDLIVQKAVELGVRAVAPLSAARCVMRLGGDRAAKRVTHWRSVAVSACEQCGRNRVPSVAEISPFEHALSACQAVHRYILAPGQGVTLQALPEPQGPIALFVGPEGGWTDAELAMAKSCGVVALTLGPRVLRTETAGPAALAALAARFGDF